jgi:hypothetical protein
MPETISDFFITIRMPETCWYYLQPNKFRQRRRMIFSLMNMLRKCRSSISGSMPSPPIFVADNVTSEMARVLLDALLPVNGFNDSLDLLHLCGK